MLVRVDGVDAGEDHGLDVFKAGQRCGGRARVFGDGVADAGVGYVFDGGDEEADFAGGELLDFDGLGSEDAHGFDVEDLAVRHEADLHALAHAAVDDAGEDDDAAVGVEPGVEDEGLERRFGIALGRRQAMDDGFEDVGDALAGLGADGNGVRGVEADGLLDHLLGARDVGAGEIDFVDDGDDFEAVVDGEVGVGEGLGLDALGGIDDEQRAFAGGEGAGDFVGEVDVAGRVDEVELVDLAVFGRIHHADGVGFDGDAALALEVHGVEDLGLHLARGQRAGELEQAVGERGLPVIDVRDDREIADVLAVHQRKPPGRTPRFAPGRAGASGLPEERSSPEASVYHPAIRRSGPYNKACPFDAHGSLQNFAGGGS